MQFIEKESLKEQRSLFPTGSVARFLNMRDYLEVGYNCAINY